jgi:hypothetical protein
MGFGFRGKIGGLVFRTVNGRTIVSAQPGPNRKRKTSVRQQLARARFSEAAAFARAATRGQQKLFYAAEAKKMGLSNAYTAALTLYLRGQKDIAQTTGTNIPEVTKQELVNNFSTRYTTSFSINTTQYTINYSLC